MMLQPQEEDKSHFTPPKAMHLWTLLLSDLTTLFSSLLTSSHPLYIAYLLFFSPHILTLLSFFCPLLLSTFLLLLTISPTVFHVDSPTLRLFHSLSMSLKASSPPGSEASVVFGIVVETLCWVVLDSEVPMQANSAIMEVEEMFEENSHSESDEQSELSPMPSYEVGVNPIVEENWLLTESESDRSFCDSTNSSKSSESPMYDAREFGSMRKEKEWERTLACKIYEERKAASDGGEGMDVLWEIYEAESRNSNASKKKDLKEERVIEGVQEEDEEEEEEEEEMTGKICCLQALKFTAKGKVNFGMGRPGLVKFSKALKGFRMFKHSKKV
ncbi:hypothetical protein QJS10_CPA10g01522 [Acorus calamus]|uniref:Uncharacterized protein n=1 Tax=Acorus calamus TaxID=4465 RepID=A0AAV9DVN7_ACOCL|nr:hypothetical protein QJS10_CPA10g01522 [Acorus calamus]